MSIEKKSKDKVYLIIGIIFFAIGAFVAGNQGSGLVSGISQVILGSIGILFFIKFYQRRKNL
tara:strand:+ start:118 stop:303 length:186 start_codon:yes stop_codon:yes gene_type:complete